MTRRPPSRVRSVFRFCWRFARTGVVCLALLIAAFFIHLHNVGLPESVKQRLVQSLEQRGWHMEFSRLRFRWMQGIVGEDLHLRPSRDARGPELFVERVDFRLSREDLRRFVFTPESLVLRQGRCVWILASSNEVTRSLTLEKVEGGILIRPKRATWDEFFSNKWDVTKNASHGADTDDESLTITDDDLLY